MSIKNDLDRWFTYHAPNDDQVERYQRIRTAGKNLAEVITLVCPDGNDRDAAIRKVREAVMTANAAIACAPREDQS